MIRVFLYLDSDTKSAAHQGGQKVVLPEDEPMVEKQDNGVVLEIGSVVSVAESWTRSGANEMRCA